MKAVILIASLNKHKPFDNSNSVFSQSNDKNCFSVFSKDEIIMLDSNTNSDVNTGDKCYVRMGSSYSSAQLNNQAAHVLFEDIDDNSNVILFMLIAIKTLITKIV